MNRQGSSNNSFLHTFLSFVLNVKKLFVRSTISKGFAYNFHCNLTLIISLLVNIHNKVKINGSFNGLQSSLSFKFVISWRGRISNIFFNAVSSSSFSHSFKVRIQLFILFSHEFLLVGKPGYRFFQ